MPGVLIVTGAGRGIGAACARAGGSLGYKVCVNYNKSANRAVAVGRGDRVCRVERARSQRRRSVRSIGSSRLDLFYNVRQQP